jgi:predicted metal-dependent hydrolase
MSDLGEKKKQAPRYPLGTVKQAKGTLARLARDVLNKKIDIQEARAAAYVVSQLIQLFKLETPENAKQGLFVNIGTPDYTPPETPDEAEKRLDELVEKHIQWKKAKEKAHEDTKRYNEEFLKRQITSYVSPGGETVEIRLPDELVENEMEVETGLSKNAIIAKVAAMEKQPEPTPESKQPATDPAAWRPCGIGVKR